MRILAALAVAVTLFPALSLESIPTQEKNTMNVKRLTPVLYVKEIEPCLKFWTERLGFEKTAEVPDGDKLGFVILQKGQVELMYQSFASQEKDLTSRGPEAAAAFKDYPRGPSFLFLEVDKLEPIVEATRGARLIFPVHNTFYGSKEICVTDPAGHFIVFAEFAAAAQH